MQPSAGKTPLAFDSSLRGVHQTRDFLNRKTRKEAQFNNSALSWVDLLQLLQTSVESQQLARLLWRKHEGLIQRDLLPGPAPFFSVPVAGMINQNATHHLGGSRKKVGAILPLARGRLKVSLMNESRGLQCMAWPLQTQIVWRGVLVVLLGGRGAGRVVGGAKYTR